MPAMTKPPLREIIEDFAKEIQVCQTRTARPAKTVINFRTEMQSGFEREIVEVPLELLRYRKDNGRIASDVLNHERNVGPLEERDDLDQAILEGFLLEKDREKTDTLRKSIIHDGQREPAIVTCDGFLINGNRRKLAMTLLLKDSPSESRRFMKVVILPGVGDPGGPPTLLEIEQIENRYQLQSEGRAEYYGFDRALSMKRKIELGMSLRDQLLDDPQFADATSGDLDKAIQKAKEDFLLPLECVDRYLKQFGREGQYSTVSAGISDRRGRWQAFIDYSATYKRSFQNATWRIENGIEEDEIGGLEVAAFNLIRLRELPEMGKIHNLMRELPKYCGSEEGKSAILAIGPAVKNPSKEDCVDATGKPLKPEILDAKWEAANKGEIIWRIKKAKQSHESRKETETPLELLDAAYKKLTHENLDLGAIRPADRKQAMKVAESIRDRADELRSELYQLVKNPANGGSPKIGPRR